MMKTHFFFGWGAPARLQIGADIGFSDYLGTLRGLWCEVCGWPLFYILGNRCKLTLGLGPLNWIIEYDA